MSYQAKDGKLFPTVQRGRMYDRSLAERSQDDVANAPGGPSWEHDLREHGPVKKTTIIREGMGRHRVEAVHADGYVHTSVHPEAHRAHQVEAVLLGIDQTPPAIQTHQRSKAHPVGPKEEERIAREDQREGPSRWEDFEERNDHH